MTTDPRADVAKTLRAIQDMANRLEARAIDRANTHDGIPGGAAMVELAPVGSLETWANRIDGLERRWSNNPNVRIEDMPNWAEAEDPDQLWPALETLWWWTEDYRRRLGMDYGPPWRPTLASEAGFLRNTDVANWIWANEPRYDNYATEMTRAKTKLEGILSEGERSERTPVVCDRCDDGRPLIRVWGDSPTDDRWKCPGCKTLLTLEELTDALATQMRHTQPREWVPRTQAVALLASLGHQTRTATRLADLPQAQGWRHKATHIQYVSWPGVWRSHLLALQAAKHRLEDATKAKAHKAMCEAEHGDHCWTPGRGCALICPRGTHCAWFMCPIHGRVSA